MSNRNYLAPNINPTVNPVFKGNVVVEGNITGNNLIANNNLIGNSVIATETISAGTDLSVLGQTSTNTLIVNTDAAISGTATLGGLTSFGQVNLLNASSFLLPTANVTNLPFSFQVFVNTIVSATGRIAYVAIPSYISGAIITIAAVNDITIAVGSLILTSAIIHNGIAANIPGGDITIPATTVPSSTSVFLFSGGNLIAPGDILRVTVSGANTAIGTAMLTFTGYTS